MATASVRFALRFAPHPKASAALFLHTPCLTYRNCAFKKWSTEPFLVLPRGGADFLSLSLGIARLERSGNSPSEAKGLPRPPKRMGQPNRFSSPTKRMGRTTHHQTRDNCSRTLQPLLQPLLICFGRVRAGDGQRPCLSNHLFNRLNVVPLPVPLAVVRLLSPPLLLSYACCPRPRASSACRSPS